MAQGEQPATASQRLGLSAAGAGGQITQVPGPEFYTMEWTSNGPRSNLESGLVPGGRSRFQSRGKPCYLKSKQPYVEGKRHGTGWEVDPYTCKCFELTWENDERVSREKVGKRTCRREIDWSAGTPWGSR